MTSDFAVHLCCLWRNFQVVALHIERGSQANIARETNDGLLWLDFDRRPWRPRRRGLRVMSSSQTTGEAPLDGKQFAQVPWRNSAYGCSSVTSCGSVEFSATALPCQNRPVGGNFESARKASGEFRIISPRTANRRGRHSLTRLNRQEKIQQHSRMSATGWFLPLFGSCTRQKARSLWQKFLLSVGFTMKIKTNS